jgi:hypothetical protein
MIAKLPKWAQSYIGDLERENVRLRGLPDAPKLISPDLEPPDGWGEKLSRGWLFNRYTVTSGFGQGVASSAVEKYCSSSVYHGYGWDKTSCQNARRLYSTEKKAWQALRADFIQWAAQKVAQIEERESQASDQPYTP